MKSMDIGGSGIQINRSCKMLKVIMQSRVWVTFGDGEDRLRRAIANTRGTRGGGRR